MEDRIKAQTKAKEDEEADLARRRKLAEERGEEKRKDNAAATITKRLRINVAKKMEEKQKQLEATRLQAAWRAKKARQKVRHQRATVKKQQTAKQIRERENERQNLAATRIQAIQRGKKTR